MNTTGYRERLFVIFVGALLSLCTMAWGSYRYVAVIDQSVSSEELAQLDQLREGGGPSNERHRRLVAMATEELARNVRLREAFLKRERQWAKTMGILSACQLALFVWLGWDVIRRGSMARLE